MEDKYIRDFDTTNPRFGYNGRYGGKSGKLLKRHKKKISKGNNTTGITHVTKHKDKECKQGFTWRYDYYDDNGRQKAIERVNLDDLEKEVKKRGLEWEIIDYDKYLESVKLNKKNIKNNLHQVKYNLWNPSIVHFNKGAMFRGNPKFNPRKCFEYKYEGYRLPIGGFHDFVSVEIINELINNAIGGVNVN